MKMRCALLGAFLGFAVVPCYAAAPNCHVGTAYTVVVRDRPNSVGEDMLVRRTDEGSSAACDGTQRPGDFAAIGPDEPGYFLWLEGRYLAIDLGTSTVRQLRILNLATRKSVWTDDVADDPDGRPPAGPVRLIWKVGEQIPLKACPATWRKAQSADLPVTTAHLIAELSFDATTGKMRKTGRTTCAFQESDVSLPPSPKPRS